MADQKRAYTKRRRADLEEQTRLRITESAVHLHGSVGPARTSISAVARHAGVQRSTVYRHFPDEEALFAACSGHWRAANPLPDLDEWQAIDDPGERLRHAVAQLYAFYRRSEPMLDNLLRDAPDVPIVARLMGGMRDYVDAARAVLLAGRRTRGAARRRADAAIGHALAFSTWQSLTRGQGLDDTAATDLMCRLVAAT